MSGHGSEQVDKHVRIYKKVFFTLVILTVVTVACSYLNVSIWLGVLIALAVATVKGSLVAAFFMHLAWERKMILAILVLSAFFVAAMMTLILGHYADVPTYR